MARSSLQPSLNGKRSKTLKAVILAGG